MSNHGDDTKETIHPQLLLNTTAEDDEIPDDDIPGLPSLPSLTQSTSETEEERRRILEGIFAEEDDDDDDDSDCEDDLLAAYLESAASSPRVQQQEQRRLRGEAGVSVGSATVHGLNEAGGNAEEDGPALEPGIPRESIDPTSGNDRHQPYHDQQQQQQQQQRHFLPDTVAHHVSLTALTAAQKKARTSESAFSSSSEDEGGDGDALFFQSSSSHLAADPSGSFSPSAGREQQQQPPIPTTPRFSNATITSPSSSSTSRDGGGGNELRQQQHRPEAADAPSSEVAAAGKSFDGFSWIRSADSENTAAASYGDNAEDVQAQGTLSFNFSQDTTATASLIANDVGRKSPPLISPSNSASGVVSTANAATATATANATATATRGDAPSASQQQRQPQSAFDRALNEVQQSGGRSARPNSFNFSNAISPVGSGEELAQKNSGDVVGAGEANDDADPRIAAAAEAASTPKEATGDDTSQRQLTSPSSATANNDDFFAKAEHTVLDEIFSENFVEDEEESGASGKGMSRDSSSSPRAKSASSPKAGKLTGSSSSTNTASSRVKDRISLHTNSNVNDSQINNINDNNNNNSTASINSKSPSSFSSSFSKKSPSSNPTAGLPDVLGAMRQKIESSLLNIFDGDSIASGVVASKKSSNIAPSPPSSSNLLPNINQQPTNMLIMDAASSTAPATLQRYYGSEEERENMRRAFQQSISAAVLVSLAHKRYERRRLAAMEIEKVVRSLVVQEDYQRVRAILLLLSDDYVRSTNEDARKGGAVALAACAIGLKKADEGRRDVAECRDLILASVVHACQDHSQRVRYYATESLFNVTKVIPSLAVQHFFILFEILRSLYADVDLDVRSGAELLDKKLKEVIVGAINSGSFSADACVPVFARFVYMRNKATKQLTLTWLKEFSEKLIGAPILQFLHLFLGGIFAMVADPNAAIRQLALEFLQSVLPRLLVNNEDFEDSHAQQNKVDFDKILQSLVLTMEHPDPFVRKVAVYWMSRIVQAHMSSAFPSAKMGDGINDPDATTNMGSGLDSMMKGGMGIIDTSLSSDMGRARGSLGGGGGYSNSAASVSVRNALPHVLPGILLSIGDTHQSRSKDSFLPDQTTHSLAEQANTCLQDAVRRDGRAFIPHLGGFIVALREELDSPGGLIARNPPSLERRPYRMDVKADGSGIESTGWFRASDGVEERDNALILSRLCALQWVVVLYEHVVPNSLKAEYASEFIDCIIYQLVDQPPGIIIVKSFEVLAKISSPAEGEESYALLMSKTSLADENASLLPDEMDIPSSRHNPMTDDNANFALGIILDPSRRKLLSRDRGVFASLIDLHSKHQKLLMDISKVIELMCTLQPPEFVFVSFAYELDNFIVSRMKHREKVLESPDVDGQKVKQELASFSKDLAFVSNFAQQLGIVFFAAPETQELRGALKDSIGFKGDTLRDERRARLFHILLYTFSHNIVAMLAFCLWGGAFLTASTFLQNIDSLDVSLMFYLEIDQLIDLIERPLFRHLHLRMLECEDDPYCEGSGAMLFRTLKSITMLLPQSTSYIILKERLTSMARYRQSAVAISGLSKHIEPGSETDVFVNRITSVRRLHCDAKWRNIRAESLEDPCRYVGEEQKLSAAQQRREWLGYADEEDELITKNRIKQDMLGENAAKKVEMLGVYENLNELMESPPQQPMTQHKNGNEDECEPCVIISPTTKGLIKRFEQMGNTGNEGKEDQSSNPQWREYWASRQ